MWCAVTIRSPTWARRSALDINSTRVWLACARLSRVDRLALPRRAPPDSAPMGLRLRVRRLLPATECRCEFDVARTFQRSGRRSRSARAAHRRRVHVAPARDRRRARRHRIPRAPARGNRDSVPDRHHRGGVAGTTVGCPAASRLAEVARHPGCAADRNRGGGRLAAAGHRAGGDRAACIGKTDRRARQLAQPPARDASVRTDTRKDQWLRLGYRPVAAKQRLADRVARGQRGQTRGGLLEGIFIIIFVTLFAMIDGAGIWAWTTRLFPRRARARIDFAGRAGWRTLKEFVRIQIFVAALEAVAIGSGAWIIGVPLATPIAAIVFFGALVPIVGSIVAGAVAVLIALLFNGWINALIMFGIVLLVNQIEGNVLHPLITGGAVKVHPLGIVLGVMAGAAIGGIAG